MPDAPVASEPALTDDVRLRAVPWSLGAGVLNAVFAYWTFGGSAFPLFLIRLGLHKEQIGLLLSLFPFCGLLALGMAPVAARFGCKRTFLLGYGLRKFVMAGLLLLPWVIAAGGHRAGVAYLCAVIGLFAALRAIAETGYYPWMQEFVPNSLRGRYSGYNAVLGMLATVAAALLAGRIIGTGDDLSRFLLIIGVGCIFGILGVAAMLPVPGGQPVADAPGAHGTGMREALRDRNFRAFLGGLGAVTLGTLFLTSFLPIFLTEALHLPDGTVVTLDTAVMLGTGTGSLLGGWTADRVGSRPILMPAITLATLVPVGWLLLPRTAASLPWCIALYATYGIANGAITVTTLRLLFNGVVPPEKRTAYTAVYYAWSGITGGLAPLLAGLLTGWHGGVDAYAMLFVLCFASLVAGALFFARVAPDDRYTTRTLLRRLVQRSTA
jgi:MFS family permease